MNKWALNTKGIYRVCFLINKMGHARPTEDQEVAGSTPAGSPTFSFVEIDHEIFSTAIPSLPPIQEGQLSVSGERMCTKLVNR